jgi:two-component system sensor histidine kinase/response regulator
MHLPLNMPSDEPGIGLPPSQLSRAFPFHLAIGKDFALVQAGPSLLRACPDLGPGVDIRGRFTLVSPEIDMDFAALSAQTDLVTIWEHKQSKLRFRGQLLSIDAVPAIVCLWSPWLEDFADLGRHGLLPEDFAIHDPSIPLLRAIHLKTVALQDECELTAKLSEQRAGLIDANAELSRQFGLLWDEFVNLQEQEDEVFKMALFANNTENAVVMTDAQGRVEWVNEAFTHITGYSLEEMLGKTPGSVLQGEKTDPKVIDYVRRQLQKGAGFGADMINYAKSGREYWIQFEVQPIRDENDTITNWMAIERDITEQKKYELALIEAKKAAEAANQAKSAFLATMSHEIRTPMNAVLGTLTLLQDSALEGEQALWVKSAYTAANTLLNLIDDILDFSKIEADKLALQHEHFSLKALLDELLQLFQNRAAAKGLSLSLAIDPQVPLALHGDPFRLRQILVNLVGNAIKFTEQGGVSIGVFLQEQKDERSLLRFHVKDSGIGIPDDALDTLFNQFVQLDTSPSRRYGGTGLGLAISKRLATLMGGDIGFSSQIGKGSDFWFTVRLDVAAYAPAHGKASTLEVAADAPAHAKASPAGLLDTFRLRKGGPSGGLDPRQDRRKRVAKILVVEDGEINRLVVTALLDKAGYHVDIAQDGVEGLEAARSGDYDLILMDVHMPEMDGYEATAAIRNLPNRPARVPILALTANVMREDRSACLAVGMNDFISKPVKKDHLLVKVADWLRKTAENAPARPLPPAREPDAAIALLDEKAWQSLASHTDARIMKNIVAIFLGDTENQIKRIMHATSVQDYQTMGFEAHSVKSAAMTMGALRLAGACQNIENARKNGNLAAALHFSQELQRVFDETRTALMKKGAD